MEEADAIVFLARACRGLFDHATDSHGRPITPHDYILHHLPLARANALIHAAAALEGNVMVWPDPQLSRRGRWFNRIRRLWRKGNVKTVPTEGGENQHA